MRKMEEQMISLTSNMEFLRKREGLDFNEMSDILGITSDKYKSYVHGLIPPDLSVLIRISEHFGVTIDELVMTKLEPNPVEPRISQNLRYLRKRAGLDLKTVAKVLGCGSKAYREIELGDPKPLIFIEEAMKLSDFFNVTLDQLLKEDLSKSELSE